MGEVSERIRAKLEAGLSPSVLEVIDDSHRHAGHAGASSAGESHFTVRIVAEAFAGINRLARQRRVHQLLAEELAGRVHALTIDAKAPGD